MFVPMPTVLKFITALFILLSTTNLPLPAVKVPVTVAEPVAVIVLAVIDPELPTTTPRSALSVICNI